MNNRKVGIEGETLACEYLQNKGFEIVERNFSCKLGEIDIVAKKENLLAIVEVKTRENTKFGMPFEAVTSSKIKNIIAVTKYYLMCHKNVDMDIRFDVISILRGQIEHIEDAFRL
ncbi:MAG: YraN family protein [Clostridia bacterium]